MCRATPLLRPAAFAALVLLGCLKPERTTGGSVEENEILAGVIVTPDGSPVAGVTVELYPVDHIPGKSVTVKRGKEADATYSARTDSKGRYAFDSLAAGKYNILSAKEGALAFRDSVAVSEDVHVSVKDTLRTPGSLQGVVGLQPQHDPRTATVHVLGTQVFVNVDAGGRFTLEGLARGRYRLRLETTEEGYTPTFEEVDVEAGEDRTLSDTLHLTYTGIPVVQGLKVRLDTLAGVARVSWKAVDYTGLGTYLVYRDARGAADPARTPIAITADTVFLDTLYPPRLDGYGLATRQFPASQALAYRVKVRSRALVAGEAFHAVDLDAVPPSWVKTFAETRILGVSGGQASLGDTVKVAVGFRNKSRALARVRWMLRGAPARVFELPGSPREGSDTLMVIGASLGTARVEAHVLDDAGDSVTLQATVDFVASPPEADAGADTTVWRGAAVTLQGRATTRFGRISTLEWAIGAGAAFVPSPDGKISFTAPANFGPVICVLRAANTDGETDLDTVIVFAGEAWEKVTERLPFRGTLGKTVYFQGRLWLVGGLGSADSGRTSLWSTVDGVEWTREPGRPGLTDRVNHAVYVWDDRLWIMAGEDAKSGRDYDDIWSSVDGKEWVRRGSWYMLPFPTTSPIYRDRVWVLLDHGRELPWKTMHATRNGHDWEQYTTDEPDEIYRRTEVTFDAFGDHLVVAGGRTGADYQVQGLVRTTQDGRIWKTWNIGPNMKRTRHSMVVGGGHIWVIGGEDESGRPLSTTANSEGDPFNWHAGPSFPEPIGPGNVSFFLAGTVWVIHEGVLWRLR